MLQVRTTELGRDRSLHSVTAGEGPDILLLHGALATHQDWLVGPFEALARFGRVTAIDRPGHGKSRRPRFEGDPRAQARQIAEGLDAIGIERSVVVAHSMGGLVALALAELFPERVSELVLVAPLAFPELRPIEQTVLAPRSAPVLGPLLSIAGERTFDAAFLRMVQVLMFSPDPVPTHWRDSFPYAEVLDAGAMVAEGEDTAAILPGSPLGTLDVAAIRTPAHIIVGTSDKIVERERQAKRLVRLMPNARLTELEGVSHMAHHARADVVLEAVREALVDCPSPAREREGPALRSSVGGEGTAAERVTLTNFG
jgi:pimeloyl-ACP methyl ester carboxylesterase